MRAISSGAVSSGDAHFLIQLANGGGLVVLAGVEVAGNAGVPEAGAHVLEQRAFLQQQVAAFVENEDVDGAVDELSARGLRARVAVPVTWSLASTTSKISPDFCGRSLSGCGS